MILMDTMVQSELRKARSNSSVVAYLKSQPTNGVFLSAMTLGKIEVRIKNQRSVAPEFAAKLVQWLTMMEVQFAPFHTAGDPGDCQAVGRLCVQTGNKGIDNLIAATALCHNLMVVTRTVKDFELSAM